MMETKTNAKQLTLELVDRLKPLFNERLVSVCMYGSAVVEDSEKDAHRDINVLVILNRLDVTDLEKAAAITRWWEQQAHALPMFLSEHEWHNAADIFALEYADIRDQHWVAYGRDLFSGVTIHKEALRLVCELEIYRKLLFLRQRLLLFRDQPDQLLAFMHETIRSFTALFRALLRVYAPDGTRSDAEGVYAALPDVVAGINPETFRRIYHSLHQRETIGHGEVLTLFEQYVAQISLVNDYLNTGEIK